MVNNEVQTSPYTWDNTSAYTTPENYLQELKDIGLGDYWKPNKLSLSQVSDFADVFESLSLPMDAYFSKNYFATDEETEK